MHPTQLIPHTLHTHTHPTHIHTLHTHTTYTHITHAYHTQYTMHIHHTHRHTIQHILHIHTHTTCISHNTDPPQTHTHTKFKTFMNQQLSISQFFLWLLPNWKQIVSPTQLFLGQSSSKCGSIHGDFVSFSQSTVIRHHYPGVLCSPALLLVHKSGT